MAVTIGDVTIRIGASTKTLNRDLRNAERSLQASAAKFKSLGQSLTLSLTAPFVALAGVSLVNYDKQIQAIGQVETALRTTGAASGKTSQELQKLASSLQAVTTFGDEEILQKSTAQLLTFTNIAGDVFDKAQLQALNLSQRLGIDLQQASIQLGKALNDPIQGINALRRSGVSFSDEQKALIKRLVETGQTVKAQELILGELEKQYGGSAEAAAKLGLGPLKQLQNLVGDLTEEFGAVISEALIPFVKYLTNIVKSYQNLDEGTKKLIIKIAGIAAVIGPALLIFGKLQLAVGLLQIAWVKLTAAFAAGGIKAAFAFLGGPAILIIGGVAAAVYLIYKNWEEVKKSMVDVGNYFVDLYNESLPFRASMNYIIFNFKQIAAAATLAFKIILSALELVGKSFINTFKNAGALIKAVLTADFKAIPGIVKNAFSEGFGNVKTLLQDTGKSFSDFSDTTLSNAKEAIDNTFNPQPLKKFSLETEKTAEKVNELNNAITQPQGEGVLGRGKISLPTLETGAANPFEPLRKNINNILADIRKNTQEQLGEALRGKVKFKNSSYDIWFKDFREQIDLIDIRQERGFISSAEADAERISFLTSALKNLQDQGFSPLSPQILAIETQLESLGIAITDDLFTKLETGQQVVQAFASNLTTLIGDAFATVGETIGAAFSGETNIATFFNKILSSVADFAKSFGKQLIAIGIAKLSLENLFKAGPVGAAAAIAAGTALIAISSAVQSNLAKNLPSLAIGTDYVKQDGLAMLHKGEAVVPADVAGGGFSRGRNGMVNVSGRIQGTDIILVSDYAMDFKTRIR